jgi:hypothetical protein
LSEKSEIDNSSELGHVGQITPSESHFTTALAQVAMGHMERCITFLLGEVFLGLSISSG